MQQAPSRGLAPMAGVHGTSSRMTMNRRQVAVARHQTVTHTHTRTLTDTYIRIPVEIMSLNVRKSVINELCVELLMCHAHSRGGGLA